MGVSFVLLLRRKRDGALLPGRLVLVLVPFAVALLLFLADAALLDRLEDVDASSSEITLWRRLERGRRDADDDRVLMMVYLLYAIYCSTVCVDDMIKCSNVP